MHFKMNINMGSVDCFKMHINMGSVDCTWGL